MAGFVFLEALVTNGKNGVLKHCYKSISRSHKQRQLPAYIQKSCRCLNTSHGVSNLDGTTTDHQLEISSPENRNLTEQSESLYRERFIPLTRRTTVSHLLRDNEVLTDSERREFEKFALSLDAVVSTQYAATLQELKQLFDPISPDKDTLSVREFTRKDRLDNEFWLLQRLGHVMEKANFYELTDAEVNHRLSEQERDDGIQVSIDRTKYDVLKFWVIGKEKADVKRPLLERLQSSLLRRPHTSPLVTYKRVVAAVRLKKDDKLTLKAFKDIPDSDLEKLLPVGSLRMGKFDRYMIGVSVSMVGLGVLAKFITILAKMSPVNWPLGFAALTSLVGVRGYWAYRGRQNRYLSRLNKTLYYKNIANNRGLITLLVDRAQDETFKEVLLTYSFIQSLNRGHDSGFSSDASSSPSGDVSSIALENAVESWITNYTGAPVEFDSTDSIAILEKIGILSRSTSGVSETYSVLPLQQAHRLLPQTPLSILTRVEESDVTEGYDRSKYDRTEAYVPQSRYSLRRLFNRFRG